MPGARTAQEESPQSSPEQSATTPEKGSGLKQSPEGNSKPTSEPTGSQLSPDRATIPEPGFRPHQSVHVDSTYDSAEGAAATNPQHLRHKASSVSGTAPSAGVPDRSAPERSDWLGSAADEDQHQSDSQGNSAGEEFEPARIGGRFALGEFFGGKYEILGHVGQGGMGVVYRARDAILDRLVAIKFLKAKSGIGALEMSRFQQEAKAIASLDHKNIIRVHDMSVTADGDPYFVLEYLDGCSLSHELRTHKKLSVSRALELMLEICDALQHAHSKGVVHRDIKPSNIMLVKSATGGDTVKLLDFGIAKLRSADDNTVLKLTKTGELFGSPHYMSPEQCSGQKIDRTTDIYSAGCVFFEMLTGGPPFSGSTPFETLDMHKSGSPPSVALKSPELKNSKAIDAVLDKMLAKNPSERYQNAQELTDDLLLLQKKLTARSFRPKKRPTVLAAASVILLVGIVITIVLTSKSKAPDTVQGENDPTPWATYDLKGQQLFDQGAYEHAERCFKKALKKAKSEKSKSRLLHVNTSLRELRMIYHTMENQKGIDLANEELQNVSNPPPKPKYTWPEILEEAEILRQSSTPREEKAFIDDVTELTFLDPETESVSDTLQPLIAKLAGREFVVAQLRVLEALVLLGNMEQPPRVSRDALKFVLQHQEDLTVRMKSFVAALAFAQPTIDLEACERLLKSEKTDENSFDSIRAMLWWAKLDWMLDRKVLAVTKVGDCLSSTERLMPRNYSLLADVLLTLASYSQDEHPSQALHLLLRAKAITDCEQLTHRSRIAARELVVEKLAFVYMDLGRFSDAEATLKSLLARHESHDSRKSIQRPVLLADLGYLYLRRNMNTAAEDCLLEAITLFENEKALPLAYQETFASTFTNLAVVYSNTGKEALSKQYAERGKEARNAFRRNLPTARR